MAFRIIFITFLLVLSTLASEVALARIWTDDSGRFTVEAELVEVRDGRVHLKKASGAIVIVRRDQLSQADRGYLESLERTPHAPREVPKDLAAADKTTKPKTGRVEIERALGQGVKFKFDKTPLRDALRLLADQRGIKVFVDQKGLDAAGIAADAPVSAAGSGESLEQSLNDLLSPLKLTWLVRDEVLLVTTAEAARNLLETRVYKVLLLNGAGPPLQDRIQSGVAPASWQDNGGQGSMAPYPPRAMLVVLQTYAVHRQIERQFAKMLRPVSQPEGKGPAQPGNGRQARSAALDQPADCRFVKTPLREVASYFAKRHDMEVALDEKALQEAGIAAGRPVTAEVRGVRLAAALDLVLSQAGLTWTRDAKGLRITTPEAADRALVTVEYDLRGLRPGGNASAPSVMEVLSATVDPRTWEENGGAGTILPLPPGNAIQVRQTHQVHREIERLLACLRQAGNP